jgi:DNA repair photolyase
MPSIPEQAVNVLNLFLTICGAEGIVPQEQKGINVMRAQDIVQPYHDTDLAREIDFEEVEAMERAGTVDSRPAGRRGRAAGFPAPTARPPRDPRHIVAARGRGATLNPPPRFDKQTASVFDDGWDSLTADLADLPPLRTTTIRDSSRTVISWNQSPDIGFDRAVNPYRGCEHGCVYCYARPSHAYLGYSPGLDFESKLLYKPDVAALLEKELRKPGYTARTLALGSNTDPYQPIERTMKLTREVLEVMERFNHPVSIVTKSAGVLRDIDILQELATRNLVRVYISVTTLDATLARRMEPRAATPFRRLQAIEQLSAAGIPTGVLAAPMIPGLNDAEMERILQAAAKAGAKTAGYILLRLPHELKQIFEDWLHQHFPDRARHVLELIRETRAGGLSDARFGKRFTGTGVYADLLAGRFSRAARELGLDERQGLTCKDFHAPAADSAAAEAQMSLF